MRHCKFSPSGAHRWMACPGSLTLSTPEPRSSASSSDYAAEGTAAHSLAEQCWAESVNPFSRVGQIVGGYEITEEMAQAVQIYLDAIAAEVEEQESQGTALVRTESFMLHPDEEDFGGTIDCLIHGPDSITVIDFKYGAGQVVEVEHNPQLLCYAYLAALECQPGHWPTVKLTVVQPRANHERGPVRSWSPTVDELSRFALRAERAFLQTSGDFESGDHCHWCPHKVNCPELESIAVAITDDAANGFQEDDMDTAQAAGLLNKRKAVELYLRAVESWLHEQLEAGGEAEGWKLVNRYGNRKFDDEDRVYTRCKSQGFGKKQITQSRLISPAQLEKLTGKEFVGSLCSRPLLGTALVPESDRRKPVIIETAGAAFEEIE